MARTPAWSSRTPRTDGQGALAALLAKRPELDRAFAETGLPGALEWPEQVNAGRWVIRYTVNANWKDEIDSDRLRDLNRASVEMKRVFDPFINDLDPSLEEGSGDSSGEVNE